MKSDVWYDEEQGIVRMNLVGKVSSEEYMQVNRKLINSISADRRKRQLINLSASESINIDRATRKQMSDEMRDSEIPGTKAAIVGASPIARMLTKVFLAMRKEQDTETRFFETEDQAIEWLRKEDD